MWVLNCNFEKNYELINTDISTFYGMCQQYTQTKLVLYEMLWLPSRPQIITKYVVIVKNFILNLRFKLVFSIRIISPKLFIRNQIIIVSCNLKDVIMKFDKLSEREWNKKKQTVSVCILIKTAQVMCVGRKPNLSNISRACTLDYEVEGRNSSDLMIGNNRKIKVQVSSDYVYA